MTSARSRNIKPLTLVHVAKKKLYISANLLLCFCNCHQILNKISVPRTIFLHDIQHIVYILDKSNYLSNKSFCDFRTEYHDTSVWERERNKKHTHRDHVSFLQVYVDKYIFCRNLFKLKVSVHPECSKLHSVNRIYVNC